MVTRARKKLRQNHGSDRSDQRLNFLSVSFPITRTAKYAKSRGGRLCDAGLDAQIERKLRQNGLARRLSQFSLNGALEAFATGRLNFFGQPCRLIFGVAAGSRSPGPAALSWLNAEPMENDFVFSSTLACSPFQTMPELHASSTETAPWASLSRQHGSMAAVRFPQLLLTAGTPRSSGFAARSGKHLPGHLPL